MTGMAQLSSPHPVGGLSAKGCKEWLGDAHAHDIVGVSANHIKGTTVVQEDMIQAQDDVVYVCRRLLSDIAGGGQRPIHR